MKNTVYLHEKNTRNTNKIDKILEVVDTWEAKFQKLDAIEEMQAKIYKMEKQLCL